MSRFECRVIPEGGEIFGDDGICGWNRSEDGLRDWIWLRVPWHSRRGWDEPWFNKQNPPGWYHKAFIWSFHRGMEGLKFRQSESTRLHMSMTR